jgi:1,2-diacylglycerol 3-beta-glucosyltransferase
MDLFLYLLGLIIGVYILMAVSSFDSRKMGVVSLFYSLIFTPLLMLFQLGVLIESYILGPLNKVTEWYKVKREKM